MLILEAGSTSFIMTSSESTVDLLEQCLPYTENIYLRCHNGEPWSAIIMCAVIMLLKIHLGKESWQSAKSGCAARFLDLYYKHRERENASSLIQQHLISLDSVGQTEVCITNDHFLKMHSLCWKTANAVLVCMLLEKYPMSLHHF